MSANLPPMNGNKRGRWAMSFADLSLLLLGFFVLLQASGNHGKAVIEGVNAQFGAEKKAAAVTGKPQSVEMPAGALFEDGEAVLTAQGSAKLVAVAGQWAHGKQLITISSTGEDRATLRFDAWDLAAARIGAVARQLKAAGISDNRIAIRMIESRGRALKAGQNAGQHIRIGTE